MYIAIEGVDGVGKSTQMDLLKEKFDKAVFIKEPGGSDKGEEILNIVFSKPSKNPITDILLIEADRVGILSNIHKKQLTISDRSVISWMVYSTLTSNLSYKDLKQIHEIVTEGKKYPDLVIIITASKDTIYKRNSDKILDHIEMRTIDRLYDAQKRFMEVCDYIGIKYVEISGDASISEVHDKIVKKIKKKHKQ